MNENDLKLLEEAGWTVECESPLEIWSEDSFAFGASAEAILASLQLQEEPELARQFLALEQKLKQYESRAYPTLRERFQDQLAARADRHELQAYRELFDLLEKDYRRRKRLADHRAKVVGQDGLWRQLHDEVTVLKPYVPGLSSATPVADRSATPPAPEASASGPRPRQTTDG